MLKRKVTYLAELVLLPLTILAGSVILSYSMPHYRDDRLYQIVTNSDGTVIYRLNLQTGRIAGCIRKIASYQHGIPTGNQYTEFDPFASLDFNAPENGKDVDYPLVLVFDCSGSGRRAQ